MRLFDPQFKTHFPNYILQSLMAIVVLIIILTVLEIGADLAIVASLGASSFIVFAMPKSTQAQQFDCHQRKDKVSRTMTLENWQVKWGPMKDNKEEWEDRDYDYGDWVHCPHCDEYDNAGNESGWVSSMDPKYATVESEPMGWCVLWKKGGPKL